MPGRPPIFGSRSTSSYSNPTVSPPPPKPSKKVFISYNHNDFETMQRVKSFLESKNISVTVDIISIKTGEEIEAFIDRCLSNHKYIISIISKNSLLSGWVSKELTATLTLAKLAKGIWIPVSIDDSHFNSNFYFQSITEIDLKISEIQKIILKAFDSSQNPSPFFDEYTRMKELKDNFSKTVETLKKVLVRDISGNNFTDGMTKTAIEINN